MSKWYTNTQGVLFELIYYVCSASMEVLQNVTLHFMIFNPVGSSFSSYHHNPYRLVNNYYSIRLSLKVVISFVDCSKLGQSVCKNYILHYNHVSAVISTMQMNVSSTQDCSFHSSFDLRIPLIQYWSFH